MRSRRVQTKEICPVPENETTKVSNMSKLSDLCSVLKYLFIECHDAEGKAFISIGLKGICLNACRQPLSLSQDPPTATLSFHLSLSLYLPF